MRISDWSSDVCSSDLHGPLAHAAGELVRVHADALAGLRDADEVEHLGSPRQRLLLVEALVDPRHLPDLPTDGVHGAQRGERVLEDHGDLAAADLAPLVVREGEQVAPAPEDLARLDAHVEIGTAPV